MPWTQKQMLRDANGDLIPQYWDVAEQEFKPLTGIDGANDVRLTGSNFGQPIETLIYQREGPLIGGGVREVLVDLKNVECELQSLSLGTNQSGIQLRIHFYKKDGSLDGSLKIANKKGTTLHHPSPVQIQNQSNGENDFWKNQVYDTENDAYVMVMKRPLKCLNGLRIEVYNWDVESRDVAINVAIAIWGGK